jgi:ribonuclease HI
VPVRGPPEVGKDRPSPTSAGSKANQDLVAELRAALSSRPAARLAYVPGHSGVILNERADALAREAVSGRKTRRDVFVSKPGPGSG